VISYGLRVTGYESLAVDSPTLWVLTYDASRVIGSREGGYRDAP
jgi:hypothetical protein